MNLAEIKILDSPPKKMKKQEEEEGDSNYFLGLPDDEEADSIHNK